MKRLLTMTTCTLLIAGCAGAAPPPAGQELFAQHCAVCHPDGGNTISPTHTLKKKDLEKEGLATWQGIVKTMRNPEPGMTKFDEKTITDKDARAIAEYILKTFK